MRKRERFCGGMDLAEGFHEQVFLSALTGTSAALGISSHQAVKFALKCAELAVEEVFESEEECKRRNASS